MSDRKPDDYPYPPNDGQTHYEGCWQERHHHNCAVFKIDRLLAASTEGDNEHAVFLREIAQVIDDGDTSPEGDDTERLREIATLIEHAHTSAGFLTELLRRGIAKEINARLSSFVGETITPEMKERAAKEVAEVVASLDGVVEEFHGDGRITTRKVGQR